MFIENIYSCNDIAAERGASAGLLLYKLFLRLECRNKEQSAADARPIARARTETRFKVLETAELDLSEEETPSTLFDHTPMRPMVPAYKEQLADRFERPYARTLANLQASREEFRRAVERELRARPFGSRDSAGKRQDTKKGSTSVIGDKVEQGENDTKEWHATKNDVRPPSPDGDEEFWEKRGVRGERVEELLRGMRRGRKLLEGSAGAAGDAPADRAEPCALGPGVRPEDRRLRRNARHSRRHAEYQRRMERLLPTELLAISQQAQTDFFDNEIACKLLHQSHYEKQMVMKLLQVRQERVVIQNNSKMSKTLMEDLKKTVMETSAPEANSTFAANAEKNIFKERTLELYKKMSEEQNKLTKEKSIRICEEVVVALMELAFSTSEYKEFTEGQVPLRIKDEWNTMLIANYPLLNMTNQDQFVARLEKLEKFKNLSVSSKDDEVLLTSDSESDQLAAEADLDRVAVREYIDLERRWDPKRCTNGTEFPSACGTNVIGHLVHRLLQIRYPFKPLPAPAHLPACPLAAALLGLRDQRARSALRRLLEVYGVLLVAPEDAMVDCMQRYKQEYVADEMEEVSLQIPSDISVVKEGKIKEDKKQLKKSTGRKYMKQPVPRVVENETCEKEVQFPEAEKAGETTEAKETTEAEERVLCASMSARAVVGRAIVQQLAAGRAVSHEMEARAVVSYLEAKMDASPWRGWVLLDMPRNHQQATLLEQHLSGRPVPPAPEDELLQHPLRIFAPFAFEEENDTQKEMEDCLRQSQIFPNPTPPPVTNVFLPYFTMVVTARREHCKIIRNDSSPYEICSPNASFTDKLYASVGISYSFYYRRFDLITIKHLACHLLGSLKDNDPDMSEKWYETLLELEKEFVPLQNSSPSKIKKRQLPEKFVFEHLRRVSQESEGLVKNVLMEIVSTVTAGQIAGQFGWFYADMDLHLMGDTLAMAWEAAEEEYVCGLAAALGVLRGHSSCAPSFMQRTRAAVRQLLAQPEPKQVLVDGFQLELGALSPEMREDCEVKAEWHLRATELKQRLVDICQAHRDYAEAAREAVARDLWIAVELSFLTNMMVMLAQLEINFLAGALQVVQEYYLTMLERPLHVDSVPRFTLIRLDLSQVPQQRQQHKLHPEPSQGTPLTPSAEAKGVRPAAQVAGRTTKRLSSPSARSTPRASRMRGVTVYGPAQALATVEAAAAALADALLKEPLPAEDDIREDFVTNPGSSSRKKRSAGEESTVASRLQRPTASQPGSKAASASVGSGTSVMPSLSTSTVSHSGKATSRESSKTHIPSGFTTPVHKFAMDAISIAMTKVEAMTASALDVIKRETGGGRRHSKSKDKKQKESDVDKDKEKKDKPSVTLSNMSGSGALTTVRSLHSLQGPAVTTSASFTRSVSEWEITDAMRAAMEWALAVNTLRDRALFRLQMIKCHANFQFQEFLDDMFILFNGLQQEIEGRYERETAAVEMLIDVLQLTIEDEGPVGAQFILEGDSLYALPDRRMAKTPEPMELPLVTEDENDYKMSVRQLDALCRRLRYLAPSGLMAERALLEQLVELTCISAGDGDARPLPLAWDALGPQGLQALLEQVYGKAEVVDWRDLLVRCLELPWPTEAQILEMRTKFWIFDPNRSENVNDEDFLSVSFWFEPSEERVTVQEDVKDFREIKELLFLLFKGFSENSAKYTAMLLHFCKDECAASGLSKALALATGCRVLKSEEDELQMRQEALAPIGRRVASFDREATDATACAIERLVKKAVRSVESPYLAWLPDDARSALLGEKPSCTSWPASVEAADSSDGKHAQSHDRQSFEETDYVPMKEESLGIVSEFFGGIFKMTPEIREEKIQRKIEHTGTETQISVHEYEDKLLQNGRGIHFQENNATTTQSFSDSFNYTHDHFNEDVAIEDGEKQSAVQEKPPWLTQLPFELAFSVLSASLLGVTQTPPPLILGPHAKSYPRFIGIIDLLTTIYDEIAEKERTKRSVTSRALLNHPLLLDLISFTTNHFIAGSVVTTVKSILDEYDLEVLKPAL